MKTGDDYLTFSMEVVWATAVIVLAWPAIGEPSQQGSDLLALICIAAGVNLAFATGRYHRRKK